jgi:Serine carboxypeptidase S28
MLKGLRQQWCNWAFPKGKYNSVSTKGPNEAYWNGYGGLNIRADRLALVDGSSDVWNELCYHSSKAPTRYSTDLHPEYFINGAGHHWDSYGIKNISAEPQFIRDVHLWEIKTVKKWLTTFKKA